MHLKLQQKRKICLRECDRPTQFKRTSSLWVFIKDTKESCKSLGQKAKRISAPSMSIDWHWMEDTLYRTKRISPRISSLQSKVHTQQCYKNTAEAW